MSGYGSVLGRQGRWLALLTGLVGVVVVSCGDDANKKKARSYESAGAGGEAGEAEVPGGRGGEPALVEPNAGAGGDAGGVGGAGGVPSVAGMGGEAPAECGPDTCPEGACVKGVCEPLTVVAADVNLSTASLTPGRECAEAIAYSVVALDGTLATLSIPPAADCLAVGDEVLLINLQGTASAYNNVGHWELLRVAELADSTVTFSRNVSRFYGNGASNVGLGLTPTSQRVALVRVPRFGRLEVQEGVTVTAQPWNGALGGVLAFRAAQVDLAGTLDATALGYRAGRWSQDDITCTNSIQTEAGESIAGTGTTSTLRNLGASGGIGAGNTSFNSDNIVVSTPGHAQAGEPGFNPKGRTIGEVGAAYGAPDATSLTLGSGPGGGLNCIVDATGATPYLFTPVTGQGGGVTLLLVDDLRVQATGGISASPRNEARDIAFAGGYVFIHGSTLALGQAQVTALGSVGLRTLGPFAGQTNRASPGYVVLSAETVTGTTEPPALTAAASAAPGL